MKRSLLIFFCTILLVACTKETENKAKTKESIKTVFVTIPKLKEKNENRIFSAIALSNHQIKLSFKVQGSVEYLKYNIGDEVKKGSLIARIDSKPYELKVSQAKYGLKEAEASAKNAKNEYKRIKKLYINQNASVSDIDNSKALFEASSAKVQNIKKELEYAQLQLSYTKLYAPQDGYVSVKYVEENENVSIGSPIILLSDKIVDEVKVQIPENYINNLNLNQKAEVIFDSLNNRKLEAYISEISKFASNETKTYQVTVKLINSSNEIKSGMSANVFFNNIQKSKSNLLLIPSSSVLNDNSGHFVYILQKNEENYLVKKQYVQVGRLTQKGFEILSNLKTDSLVLKAGMSEVYENMKVEIGNLKDLGN